MSPLDSELRIVAVNGCLGYGFAPECLDAGLRAEAHLFGADAGSTDPGAYYLGAGTSLVRREQVRRDLELALVKARSAHIPLVIGSAGMGGGEPNLAFFREILLDITRANKLHFRLATLHAEISAERVLQSLRSGGITAMPDAPELSEADIRASTRIVGQMGTDSFAHALAAGADVVLAGRACDTAIYAALPIARGFDPGLALHMAKIMECGAQCAIPLAPNDSLLGTIRKDHFLIRPLAPHRICTPESVAAHTMYEQGDPYVLHEPEGRVDLRNCDFEQLDSQTVRVSGARFEATPRLRIKLEGARARGFRAFTLAGIRDAAIIANLDNIEASVREAVRRNLGGSDEGARLNFRYYGRDAVLGALEPHRTRLPHEVGALIEAIAPTQALADHMLSLARSSFLHCPFPGRKTTAGNLAFASSPSDVSAGAVYEFSVYHLMDVDNPLELFPMELEQI